MQKPPHKHLHRKNRFPFPAAQRKRHPEAEAVCALSEHVHLITKEQDIPACAEDAAIFVTSQTTMSIYDVRQALAWHTNAVGFRSLGTENAQKAKYNAKYNHC